MKRLESSPSPPHSGPDRSACGTASIAFWSGEEHHQRGVALWRVQGRELDAGPAVRPFPCLVARPRRLRGMDQDADLALAEYLRSVFARVRDERRGDAREVSNCHFGPRGLG